jgi:hypothetical protein
MYAPKTEGSNVSFEKYVSFSYSFIFFCRRLNKEECLCLSSGVMAITEEA